MSGNVGGMLLTLFLSKVAKEKLSNMFGSQVTFFQEKTLFFENNYLLRFQHINFILKPDFDWKKAIYSLNNFQLKFFKTNDSKAFFENFQ